MTVNYKLDVTSDLRKYLWDQLVEKGIFDLDDYWSDNINDNIVPIIPVQQSAELNQFLSGKKHIVYDKIGIGYEDLWAICTEQVMFTIYSTDISEINEIRNLMIDMFRRMDDSASDINLSDVISNKFKFHTIYISDMSPIAPSEELQGFLAAELILEVKYSRDLDSKGRYV